ncbi:hypothetical protein G9A89_022198 [Geosiphon pyriformis]|nr:hypothetical protein G9A89_022198 [Geosiphon pyriformis]
MLSLLLLIISFLDFLSCNTRNFLSEVQKNTSFKGGFRHVCSTGYIILYGNWVGLTCLRSKIEFLSGSWLNFSQP